MKKGLLALLLAVAMVVPAFAAKGDMEIVGKLGLNLNPNVSASGEYVRQGAFKPYYTNSDCDCGVNMSALIGAEFFYYLNKNVALGFGINNNFNADLKGTSSSYYSGYKIDSEIGFTNFYFAVKPKIDLKSEKLNSVYFLWQLGYGLLRFDSTYINSENNKLNLAEVDSNGLYWGIGVGVEIKNFILELLYSVNYGTIKLDKIIAGDNITADLTYKTLALNIGYKFSL